MELNLVAFLAINALIGLLWGWGFCRWQSRSNQVARGREKEISRTLDRAGIDTTGPAARRLNDLGRQRQRAGAVAGGIGCAITMTLFGGLQAVNTGDDWFVSALSILAASGISLGLTVGHTLVTVHWLRRPSAGVRVSALQPHSLNDYLSRPQMAFEAVAVLLGWGSVLAAVLFWAGVSWARPQKRSPLGRLRSAAASSRC